jgi:hypothetical protein
MSRWTDEELRELVTLWPTNSATQIAKRFAPPALGDTQQGRAAAPGGTTAAQSSPAFRRQSAKAAVAEIRHGRRCTQAAVTIAVQEIERRIATATPPNRLTTQDVCCSGPGAMRMGAAMTRFGSS